MVKLLVKKELKNLFRTYFVNQKSGNGYSKGKTVGFIALFVFLMIILMGMFFGMSLSMSGPLVSGGLGWFYFAIMGMMALALGVFGDVFNTYAMLYKAKDNELLLSLPIPPSKILISRMFVVFMLGMLYESLVFIPAIIGYWLGGAANSGINIVSAIISQIVIYIALGLFITTLTCILGWLVALLSNKLKHKNFAVIILSVAFFGLYYLFCMKLSDFINALITSAEAFGNKLKSAFYPAYAFGVAGTGSLLHTLVFASFSIIAFALCVYVISISFRKITTTKTGSAKRKYTGFKGKRNSIYWALWKTEGRRFLSIPTYTLNAGLGIIIMPVALVLLVINLEAIRQFMGALTATEYAPLLPMVISAMMGTVVSMDCGSAPSVSLEGKSIWILQSSPIEMPLLMRSKIDFHFMINLVPSTLLAFVGSILLGLGWVDVVLVTIYSVAFTYLVSSFGMVMGTMRANINWTNPIVPIKQSMAVMITLFGGWILALVYPLSFYFIRSFMPPLLWKIVMTGLILLFDFICYRWCVTKGAKLIKEL